MQGDWRAEAVELDKRFPTLREKFEIPEEIHSDVSYLCGNSLGLMPKAARTYINAELNAWARLGVTGHTTRNDCGDPWVNNDERVAERLSRLIFGCRPTEVAMTGTLTTNINSLFQAFYKPNQTRYKILCEAKAFPSDAYAFQNQVKMHYLDPSEALVEIAPRDGERCLRTEDILQAIEKHGDSISIICFSAIQYYSGQLFDIPKITEAGHNVGAVVGWDLAHASGNVELRLHDWKVDFAVWCSYKYLNCGPGNMGGIFVHDDFAARFSDQPRPAGWWGVDVDTRFEMRHDFVPSQGARGFCQSNLNFLGPPCMHASLDVFEEAGGVSGLQPHRRSLVGFMSKLLTATEFYGKEFEIITDEIPESENWRGAQLSLEFCRPGLMLQVQEALEAAGVVGDERKPSVLRLAANPLYNTHVEVADMVHILNEILKGLVA